jgi:nitroreductase
MDLLEAINERCSHRYYLETPMKEGDVQKLRNAIAQMNRNTELNIQLILNTNGSFEKIKTSYGIFSGVLHYVAVVGKDNEIAKEKAGYFGEKLVLEATRLGLGTCWIGASYDKKTCLCERKGNEALFCIIAIGNISARRSVKENIVYHIIHRNIKAIEELYDSGEKAPPWFINGIKAVQKAPSSSHLQPVRFHFNGGGVTASIAEESPFSAVNLGIAKQHFELGAGNGSWGFGREAVYTVEKEPG